MNYSSNERRDRCNAPSAFADGDDRSAIVSIESWALDQARCLVLATGLPDLLARCHFTPLAITLEHGHRAGLLAGAHKDPFDRMLAAQAIMEGMGLVTADPAMAGLGARVVW